MTVAPATTIRARTGDGSSRPDEANGVGDVLELEAVGLAEVVAVELVREGCRVLDDEVVDVDLLVDAPAGPDPAAAQGAGQRRQDRAGPHRAERDHDQPPVERGGVRQVEAAVAE